MVTYPVIDICAFGCDVSTLYQEQSFVSTVPITALTKISGLKYYFDD